MRKDTYIKKDNIVARFRQCGEMREASILINNGCTYTERTRRYHSVEEGNEAYKLYINDGFVKATADDYDRIVRGY